jgi:hypothetical protein
MKPEYKTFRVAVGAMSYDAECRLFYPRAGANSPRFLDAGSPPRVQVLRIYRDRIEVTHEILWWTRRAINEDAQRQGAEYLKRALAVRRERRRARRRSA